MTCEPVTAPALVASHSESFEPHEASALAQMSEPVVNDTMVFVCGA